MKNINNFILYKPYSGYIIIKCKLGYWQVKGSYSQVTMEKAEKKYLQYKAAGKYKNILKEKAHANSIKFK